MKTLLMLVALAGTAPVKKEYQVCTPEGVCALRLTDGKTGKLINVAENISLSSTWAGSYLVVDAKTYEYLKTKIPEQYTIFIPSVGQTDFVKPADKAGTETRALFINGNKYEASGVFHPNK